MHCNIVLKKPVGITSRTLSEMLHCLPGDSSLMSNFFCLWKIADSLFSLKSNSVN